MKTLLLAIKTALHEAPDLSFVADGSIMISEDESLLDATQALPILTIKDGEIDYDIEAMDQETTTMFVHITAFMEYQEDGSTILRNDSGVVGILDLISRVKNTLTNNKLGETVSIALPATETESTLVEGEDFAIQVKSITLRYEKFDS